MKSTLALLLLASITTLALAQPYPIEFTVKQSPVLEATIHSEKISARSIQLEAQVAGGSPEYSFLWYPATGLSDVAIANPVLSLSQAAEKYYLEITDFKGCSLTIEYVPQPTGIKPLTASNQPVKIRIDEPLKSINIFFEEPATSVVISIFNISGMEIERKCVEEILPGTSLQIPFKKYHQGVYIVSIDASEYKFNEKIIIK